MEPVATTCEGRSHSCPHALYFRRVAGRLRAFLLLLLVLLTAIEGHDFMALRGPAGVLYDLVVDPAHRGQGIGRLLLDATLAALRARDAARGTLYGRGQCRHAAPLRAGRLPPHDDRDDRRAGR
jgi:GNAT superfamily N-acetyltransferase